MTLFERVTLKLKKYFSLGLVTTWEKFGNLICTSLMSWK